MVIAMVRRKLVELGVAYGLDALVSIVDLSGGSLLPSSLFLAHNYRLYFYCCY